MHRARAMSVFDFRAHCEERIGYGRQKDFVSTDSGDAARRGL